MKGKLSAAVLFVSLLFILVDGVFACDPEENEAPYAVLSANPSTVPVDVNTILDGSDSYDSDGTIEKWEWDFTNDGYYDYYETPSYCPDGNCDGNTPHAYLSSGTYTVKLRVTDNQSAWRTDTCTVTVQGVHNVTTDAWYTTIQTAIDDANDEDDIIVHQGIYTENIDFNGANCTVRSTDANDWAIVSSTVIEANDVDSSIVTFDSSEGPNSVLSGFKIIGGARGIYCNGASPTISNCMIMGNGDGNTPGAGVYSSGSSAEPRVTDCLFVDNDANYGGGMYNLDSSPILTNCVFMDNTADVNGGAIHNYNCEPNIINCTFTDNYAENGGGMCSYGSSCEPNVVNCIFWGNDANNVGDEIYSTASADPNFKYCDIKGSGGSSNWDPNFGSDDGDNIDTNPQLTFVDLTIQGLVSHWKFDEGTGATAYDSAGINHATIHGDPSWGTPKVGSYALDFDGVGDYVDCGGNPDLMLRNNLSMEFWFKSDTSGGNRGVVGTWKSSTPADSGYMVIQTNSGYLQAARPVGTNWNLMNSTFSVTDGNWYHVAVVYNGSGTYLYIDGSLDNSNGIGSNMNPPSKLTIASTITGSVCLDGTIDDVRIYDRALSGTEILQLYQAGSN